MTKGQKLEEFLYLRSIPKLILKLVVVPEVLGPLTQEEGCIEDPL